MTLDDLIALLEKAETPSSQLDMEICVLLDTGRRVHRNKWIGPDPFTSSIDAALTLVPEGFCWEVALGQMIGTHGPYWAEVYPVYNEMAVVPYPSATPAIALCIAALKARKEQP